MCCLKGLLSLLNTYQMVDWEMISSSRLAGHFGGLTTSHWCIFGCCFTWASLWVLWKPGLCVQGQTCVFTDFNGCCFSYSFISTTITAAPNQCNWSMAMASMNVSTTQNMIIYCKCQYYFNTRATIYMYIFTKWVVEAAVKQPPSFVWVQQPSDKEVNAGAPLFNLGVLGERHEGNECCCQSLLTVHRLFLKVPAFL